MSVTMPNRTVHSIELPQNCVEKAKDMRETLLLREPATIAARKISVETIADFHKAGFFRLLQPARWGGLDANFDVVTRVIDELAQGCASSAWVYSVVGLHHLYLSAWPDDVQEAVWGRDTEVLMSSGLAPRPVERVAGGYMVRGDWQWSSGSDHAKFAMVGGAPNGLPPVMMLIPMKDIQIVDDWHTLGLRGTGSKTLRFDGLFVPDHWVIQYADLMAPNRTGNPRDPQSFWDRAPNLLFSGFCFSSVVLGLAKKAVKLAASDLRTKVSRGVKLGESPTQQLRIGEVLATVNAADFFLHESARKYSERVRRGEQFTSREIWESAAAIAASVRQLRNAVFMLADTSSQWVYDKDPLQQVIRDIFVGASHRSASLDAMYTPSGKTMITEGGF